jgi:hypothetical protein
MDIGTQSEVILRQEGYDTWAWTGASPPVICFENATLVGFIHVFATAEDLLANWEVSQQRVLARHAPALRAAGTKAWNVYSIFLTSEQSLSRQREIERLEENFALTRKIARSAVQSFEDLSMVLMPLAPIRSQPLLDSAAVADRLRARAKDVPPQALEAFLSEVKAQDVAEILGSIS